MLNDVDVDVSKGSFPISIRWKNNQKGEKNLRILNHFGIQKFWRATSLRLSPRCDGLLRVTRFKEPIIIAITITDIIVIITNRRGRRGVRGITMSWENGRCPKTEPDLKSERASVSRAENKRGRPSGKWKSDPTATQKIKENRIIGFSMLLLFPLPKCWSL